MNNPGLALYLYVLVLVTAFLLSPRWGKVRDTITSAANAKQATTTDTVNPHSAGATGGTHTP